MIQFFIGDDVRTRNAHVQKIVDKNTKAGARIFLYNGDGTEGSLLEYLGGQTLFNEAVCVIVHSFFEDVTRQATFVSDLARFIESKTQFVFVEREILSPLKAILKKNKIESEEFFLDSKKETNPFNVFSLGDALISRDKKLLWVLYEKAKRANLTGEDILNTLNWQIKNLYLVSKTADTSKLTLKPFVVQKTKRGLSAYSKEEIQKLAVRFTNIFHEGRRGADVDALLEETILSI
jgi:hypothetical protein